MQETSAGWPGNEGITLAESKRGKRGEEGKRGKIICFALDNAGCTRYDVVQHGRQLFNTLMNHEFEMFLTT